MIIENICCQGCLLSGAIIRIGGAQKRADGVSGAKYSIITEELVLPPAQQYTSLNVFYSVRYFI